MKKKLLMLVCSTSHESPWFTTLGTEECIKVKGLSDQDSVALVIDHGDSTLGGQRLDRGVNPIQALGKRYKVAKIAKAQPAVPTTVEIYFT